MKHEWESMWSTRRKACHVCMRCHTTVIELIGIDGTKPPEEGCEPGKPVPVNLQGLAKDLISKPPSRPHTLSNDELAEAIGVTVGLIKSLGSVFVDSLKKHLELLLEEQARRAKVPYEKLFPLKCLVVRPLSVKPLEHGPEGIE